MGPVNKGSFPFEALNITLNNNKTFNTEMGIQPIVEYFHGLVLVLLLTGIYTCLSGILGCSSVQR